MQWQSFLEALNRKLKGTRHPREIKTKVKSEYELMVYLLADEAVRKFVSVWLGDRYNNREIKSLEKARMFKAAGNKEFQAKDYIASIQSYTKSALYAPSDSEDLSVAIANRSASLFYLERYEECIKDIELAIQLKYPEKLRYKLYLRKVQCYLKLGKKKLAEEAMHHIHEMKRKCEEIPDMKKEDIEKQIMQLNSIISSMQSNIEEEGCSERQYARPTVAGGENPNFPSASVAVEKKHSVEKGRYVVAKRDIKRGEILFVEKPFTFVLLDHDKPDNLCEYCCCSYGNVPVPCTTCLDTLYCSTKCQNAGWTSFHQWECLGSQIGLWEQVGTAHLALRILLTCVFTSDLAKFNEVQNLVTNLDKLSSGDLVICGITATMLTLYLSEYTDFFDVINIEESLVSKFSNENFNINQQLSTEDGKWFYVSSLLLRHILQLLSNGHAITRLSTVASNKEKVLTEQQDRVATAIYCSASMLNHSCDPNIINSFMDQYLIIKAIKDISAGEEIFNCYGPHFRRMCRENRQEILESQYCFICTCEPCTNPELQYFLERFIATKCPECDGAVSSAYNYSCLDCGATTIISYLMEIKQAQDLFEVAQVYIETEREEQALDNLKQCLGIRRSVLYKYHEDITSTLDLIGKVYAIIGRWLDSISYLEHSIAAVEERFGPTSIELANELNKLTDICIQYLQEEPNTATKWYKNTLKKTRRYLDRAEEIINLNYGPWVDACSEITQKKKVLTDLLKDFNI